MKIQLCAGGTKVQLCAEGTKVRLNTDACPCLCDSSGSQYRLKAYTDGDLAASTCTNCQDLPGGETGSAWGGDFNHRGSGAGTDDTCYWEYRYGGALWILIDGKTVYKSETYVYRTRDESGACHWVMQIACQGPADPYLHVLWSGAKSTGQTPAGVYTRTGGFLASPSSLEVESY